MGFKATDMTLLAGPDGCIQYDIYQKAYLQAEDYRVILSGLDLGLNSQYLNYFLLIVKEIDIDLDDPEVEAAATKIQAGFKGHKARKQVKEMQSDKKGGDDEEKQEDEIDKKNEEESEEKKEDEIDIDLTDPDVEAAATKIQAGFKGHKARKEVSQMKTDRDDAAQTDAGVEDTIDVNVPTA